MAEPTRITGVGEFEVSDVQVYRKFTSADLVRYQTGHLIGAKTNGYAARFNDSESLRFLGHYNGPPFLVEAADAVDSNWGKKTERVRQPHRIKIPLYTGTADVPSAWGKVAYGKEGGTCVVSPVGLTYANPIGKVVDIYPADVNDPGDMTAAASVVIEPVYGAWNIEDGACRVMSATGNQTITVWDFGKTIYVPNTAALTLALPAPTDVPIGSRIRFLKTTSDAEIITLDPASSATINGASTFTALDAQYDTVTIAVGVVAGVAVYLVESKQIA
jgi:hypothetical protein